MKKHTSAEIVFKKKIIRLSLFFSVIAPLFCSVVLGGGELIVYYFASVSFSEPGIIAAQVISFSKEIVSDVVFLLSLALLGGAYITLGPSGSREITLYTFLSPFISFAASFLTVCLLAAVGWYDETLSMFLDGISVNLFVGLYSVTVSCLFAVCAVVMFSLEGQPKTRSFASEKRYNRSVSVVAVLFFGVITAGNIYDIVTYASQLGSLNGIMKYLVVPFLTVGAEAFVFGRAFLLLRGKLDSAISELQIPFGK